MNRFSLRYKLLVLTVMAFFVWAIAADIPFTFKPGDLISADQMNQNFAALNNGKQELIKGTCAAGSSIRVIAADGSVTCEVDDIGNGSNSGVDAVNGMTGAVTLQAGDNITIDDSQKGQIKISSSSAGGTNSNNHDHFGQTWTGTNDEFGLSATNTSDLGVALLGRRGSGSGLPGMEGSAAIWGDAERGAGVFGSSQAGIGVFGFSSSQAGIGVSGVSSSGDGVRGASTDDEGVQGESVRGGGVLGKSTNDVGVYGQGGSFGGFFTGNVGLSVANSNEANPDLELGGNTGIITGNDLQLKANGAVTIQLDQDNNSTSPLNIRNGENQIVFSLVESGDVTILGTLTEGSDRNIKHDIQAVNSRDVLEKVATLPVSFWRYDSSPDALHVGPMAQDFYGAFGLGNTDKGIATVDADGISLAAIQGLYQLVQEQNQFIQAQEKRIAALETQLTAAR